MAEREGFEPSKEFKSLHDFQSCALDQLSHLSIPIQFAALASQLHQYTTAKRICQQKILDFLKIVFDKQHQAADSTFYL